MKIPTERDSSRVKKRLKKVEMYYRMIRVECYETHI